MIRVSRMVLAAAVVGLLAPTARAAEPDKLLPAEADTVVHVNVRQILDSDIVKKYAIEQLKQVLDGQDAKKLLTELGLDPLADVDKVTVGAMIAGRNDSKYLLIAQGKFDPDKLYKAAEAYSKKDGDRFSMVKDGKTVMFKYQPEDGQQPVYATVINEKMIIAGSDKKMISTALAAADGNKPAPIKKELADLVKKMDEKSSVYAVSIVKGKFDDVKLPGGGNLPVDLSALQKLLPKTETVSLSVKIGTDVDAAVTLGMADEETAGDMRNALDDLIKQVKPLAQLAGAADAKLKPLGDIINTVKTSSKNKDVTVTGKVTGANIGKMVKPDGQ